MYTIFIFPALLVPDRKMAIYTHSTQKLHEINMLRPETRMNHFSYTVDISKQSGKGSNWKTGHLTLSHLHVIHHHLLIQRKYPFVIVHGCGISFLNYVNSDITCRYRRYVASKIQHLYLKVPQFILNIFNLCFVISRTQNETLWWKTATET